MLARDLPEARSTDEEGRLKPGAPLSRGLLRSLGQGRLANVDQQVMPHFSVEHVVLFLEARHGGFQVPYSLLEAAHL
jgi:hypothetical protein